MVSFGVTLLFLSHFDDDDVIAAEPIWIKENVQIQKVINGFIAKLPLDVTFEDDFFFNSSAFSLDLSLLAAFSAVLLIVDTAVL